MEGINLKDIAKGNGPDTILLTKDKNGNYTLAFSGDSMNSVRKQLNKIFDKIKNHKN